MENQWEVDKRGDSSPCSVQSQTIVDLDSSTHTNTEMKTYGTVHWKKTVHQSGESGHMAYQYSEAVQVFPVECLQPKSIVICGVATEEQGTKVGNHDHD